MSEMTKTKELIFDTFVEMTSSLGYENVSMRDIAQKVGIQVASIYNHFSTKGDILEFAYNYYSTRKFDNRIPIDDMKALIKTTSAEDFIEKLFYKHDSEDTKKYVRVVLITKIIYMRIFQDPIANALFKDYNEKNSEYIKDILRHGVDIGRIDPGFNIAIFGEIIISVYQMMAIKAFSGVSYVVGQIEHEDQTKAMIARLLSTALI
jgi:AcrR family transcriptional regulator